jgi:hypothetical protein
MRINVMNLALKAWAVRLVVGGMAVYIVYPHAKAVFWSFWEAIDSLRT